MVTTLRNILARGVREKDCLRWRTGHDKDGYGVVSYRNRQWRVHRLIWVLWYGPVPKKHDVHHLCHVRDCILLTHLKPMTKSEHMRYERARRWWEGLVPD